MTFNISRRTTITVSRKLRDLLSIMKIGITKEHNETQYNDNQNRITKYHNGTQYNDSQHKQTHYNNSEKNIGRLSCA